MSDFCFKPLTREDVEVTVSVSPEEEDFRNGHFEDPEAVNWIAKELRFGNEWAWCIVTVNVSWNDFAVKACLGMCSYESEAAFKEGGYFDDMVTEGLDELNKKVGALVARVAPRLEASS